MNKRILILVGVVICMFLNVMMPMKVNALGNDPLTENQSGEVSVTESLDSAKVEGEEPAKVEGEEPAKVEGEEPAKVEGEEPAKVEGEEPAKVEGEDPAKVEGEEPAKVEGEDPAKVEGEEPAKAEGETLPAPALAKAAPSTNDVQSDDEPKEEVPVEETDDLTDEVEAEVPTETIQKAKVTFKKLDEEGNFLPGAKMQVKNKATGETYEWTTGTEQYELELQAGVYIIHEVKAPDGYEPVADATFTLDVIINEDVTGYVTNISSPTGTSQLYYVTINEEVYEVYCINQGLKTPDGNEYTGKILTPSQLRNFTKQETEVDTLDENGNRHYTLLPDAKYPGFYADSETIANYDVSDQTMTDQELYDKTLDIIYHRNMIQEKFPDMNLTEEEIRFITEWALKNYLNARITTSYETVRYFTSSGVYHYYYYVSEDGQPIMDANGKPVTVDSEGNALTGKTYYRLDHKFYYREYRYAPGEEGAVKDVIVDPGHGDSFGQIAKGMSQALRDRYAILYYYLIGDDNNDGKYDHPDDMQLYMYSPLEVDGETSEDTPYQNVLGIAGFFKDIKVVGKDIEITDKYSTEKVSVTIKKVWDDNDNQDGKRPTSVTVKLSNGTEVTLDETNNWTATIKDLPKYDKGKLITYSWEEIKLPDGYTLTSNETEGYVTTLTNTYTPEVKSVNVTKVWADDDDEEKKRPENVTITLLANGKEYDTIVLSEENEWKHEFKDLPVYDAGEKIEYTVREENVPEGYVASYEEDGETGFIIHNVKGEGDHEPPPKNPQTGDNIILYLITLLLSIIGFVSSRKYQKVNN